MAKQKVPGGSPSLDEEQRTMRREAEKRYVPADLRWVAEHPFLGHGDDSQKKYPDALAWAKAARRISKAPCPSRKALNMLRWAIDAPEKFWVEYNKSQQNALKKAEADREKKAARMDTVEKIEEARASLDAHLARLGLSRHTVPPPQFPAPSTSAAAVT